MEIVKTNIDELIGIYIPTNKNNLVSGHYKKLNFELLKKEKKKLMEIFRKKF